MYVNCNMPVTIPFYCHLSNKLDIGLFFRITTLYRTMANLTSKCSFWPENPSKCHNIVVLLKVFSSISLLGCIFIIGTICLFKLYKYFVQRLILFLSISAVIKVITNLCSVDNEGTSCIVQAFMLQYFNWAELLWVCCITANIVLVLNGVQAKNYELWFHLIVWLVSLAWSVIPFIGSHYGPAGMWCWIRRDVPGLRFGIWYIPLLLFIVAAVVVYMFICVRTFFSVDVDEGFRYEEMQRRDILRQEVKPLFAYPLIYLIFSLPVAIYRIDDAIHPNLPPKYILLVLSVISTPMLGGLNAIVFSLYGDTLKMLSWNNIKGAFLSLGEGPQVYVRHNYDVTDYSSDNQALLYHKGDEHITMKYGTKETA